MTGRRSLMSWAALTVAACGVAVTAHGLYAVAVASGVPWQVAVLYPVIADGLALVAYSATRRLRSAAYPWLVVVVAAGLSGTAQGYHLAQGVPLWSGEWWLRFGIGAGAAVAVLAAAHLVWLVDRPRAGTEDVHGDDGGQASRGSGGSAGRGAGRAVEGRGGERLLPAGGDDPGDVRAGLDIQRGVVEDGRPASSGALADELATTIADGSGDAPVPVPDPPAPLTLTLSPAAAAGNGHGKESKIERALRVLGDETRAGRRPNRPELARLAEVSESTARDALALTRRG